jgi:chromosome partitioning protein
MKYVTFVNGKGGVGKTTLTVGCALSLHALGRPVLIVDTDKQQTATAWWKKVVQNPVEGTSDVSFVDTPPDYDSPAWIKAVHQATHLFLVTSPSPADLKTSKDTIERLRKMTKTPVYLIFNQIDKRTILSQHIDEYAKRLDTPALRSTLSRKQEFQHAVVQGWNSLSNQGKIELQSIVLEILTIALK